MQDVTIENSGKTKCYNLECNNHFLYEETESCFCSLECKAAYNGTTVLGLRDHAPKKTKRTVEEWIKYFKSPERKAMYHEQQKNATIGVKSLSNNVEGFMDFLSTPLGEEYARRSS